MNVTKWVIIQIEISTRPETIEIWYQNQSISSNHL